MTTTGASDTDVDVGEFIEAEDQERFVNFESENLWLYEGERGSVNFDESLASLC